MKPLRIWTPVWGQKHIRLLEKGLAQSLLWPKNFEAIKNAQWNIFCRTEEFDQVMNVVTTVLPEEQIETVEAIESCDELTAKRGDLLCKAFLKVIESCLNDKSQCLISTPDFIWGDGSIANMRILGQQENTIVSLPHPRVLPSIIDFIHNIPRPNYDLVTLAMANPHRSWASSEYGCNPSSTEVGGILWRRTLTPGVITLQHRMPSPYLCNFIPPDLEFFRTDDDKKKAGFGAIDHDWAERYVEQQRLRMILSSDVAFMAEVTDADKNVPPLRGFNATEPDIFWKQEREEWMLHHKTNRQYIATFRGKP